jgi:hypothetical protein
VRNSVPLMVTGILLTSVGAIGLVAGGALYASASDRIDVYCDDGSFVYQCQTRDDEDRQVGGAVLMIAGGAALAVGIPLLIVGARKVPVATAPGDSPPATPGGPPPQGAVPPAPSGAEPAAPPPPTFSLSLSPNALTAEGTF